MKVDSRVSHFILPIGATVNKDGTAMFVAIASIFIAQMNGYTLGPGELCTVAWVSILSFLGYSWNLSMWKKNEQT